MTRLPAGRVGSLGLLGVGVLSASTSGPITAGVAVGALAAAFWRNAFAAAVLVPASLAGRRRSAERRVAAPGERRAVLAAGLLLAAHFATWMTSARLTSVATATALTALQPVWALLLVRREGTVLRRTLVIGVVLAVAGALLLTGLDVGGSGRALAGDGLALAGGAFAAAYFHAGARARASLSTTDYTAACYGLCAVTLLPVCLLAGQSLAGYSARDWLLLAALTVGPQLLGHSLFNHVVPALGTVVVGVALLLEIPGAALMALVTLGQHPSWLAVPALTLVVAGLAVVLRSGELGADDIAVPLAE
ncbi:MAG TPA: DMT family transporter [Frankiaceae bacterium]